MITMFLLVIVQAEPVVASRQETAKSSLAVIDALADCRRIASDEGRLSCYDTAARKLGDDLASEQIVIVDRSTVQRTRRSLFGFRLPSTGLLGEDKEAEGIVEYDGTIAKVLKQPDNRYELVLEDGARWLTIEPSRLPPDVGAKVHIRAGALGSYWIKAERSPVLRGRRIG